MSEALGRALGVSDRPRGHLELVAPGLGSRRRRGRWPFAVIGAIVGAAAAVPAAHLAPRFAQARIEQRLRSAAAALASPPAPSVAASAAPPAPVVAASPPAPVPTVPVYEIPSAVAPEVASVPAVASAPATVARVRMARPGPAPAEAQRRECWQGQRRCSGSVLQLCNASLDGWTPFIECGDDAVCDATKASPCQPIKVPPEEDVP